MEKWEAL